MTALNPSVRLVQIQNLPNPNKYVKMMGDEFKDWVFDESQAPLFKGQWRSRLGLSESAPLDLEIGTGNGYYFAHYASQNPSRTLIGMELKFKPLIQAIKRSVNAGNKNSYMMRFHASLISNIFAPGELNRVFLYFPDPWPKKKHFKNRLVTKGFLNSLHAIQRPGEYFEIKTDHPGYFDWILEHSAGGPYEVSRHTRDLHNSEWSADNFQTHFEKLWTSQGLPTHLVRFERR